MLEIVQFEEDQTFDVPSIIKSKDTTYMKQVTSIDDRLIVVLEHDGILSEDEQSKIKAVIKK
jgi:purine-binding chemotaxis protein CheW